MFQMKLQNTHTSRKHFWFCLTQRKNNVWRHTFFGGSFLKPSNAKWPMTHWAVQLFPIGISGTASRKQEKSKLVGSVFGRRRRGDHSHLSLSSQNFYCISHLINLPYKLISICIGDCAHAQMPQNCVIVYLVVFSRLSEIVWGRLR